MRSRPRLTFVPNQEEHPAAAGAAEHVVAPPELKSWLRTGRVVRKLGSYSSARLWVSDIDHVPRPLRAASVLRLLSRGSVSFDDGEGRSRAVTARDFARMAGQVTHEALFGRRRLLASLDQKLTSLEGAAPGARPLDRSRRPLYLKTDLVFGLKAGGSVAHTAGVLNHLDAFGHRPLFVTPVRMPTVRPDVETVMLTPEGRFAEFSGLPTLAFNEAALEQSRRAVLERLDGRPAFVYQRYSAYNFTGAVLAHEYQVPFVLEYNGSEIWIQRHWGKPLAYEALGMRIEDIDLCTADLVVVVSAPMRDELVERGIPVDRILVNPNGVDPDRYSPAVNGDDVRRSHGLNGRLVVGFIGTFGRWHGAEVLVDGFAAMLRAEPELRERARLLLVGDGATMPEVRERIAHHGLTDLTVLTGLVPHDQGPAFLAACDVFASPHVPNADGSPFFGSPTKLFEYLAMGRAIVASDLDQIGEVLEHDRTGWLVTPGDPVALGAGLARVLKDPALRDRLGAAGRRAAVERHTWEVHTQRILDRLVELVP